jgi:hypothetical protein
LDQLIVEMTYMTKMKNLTINRRVSLSFRDAALGDIFTNNLQYTKILIEQFGREFGTNSAELDLTLDSLEVCLETYNKCLTFDFIAILLNETLDEPSQTNLPTSWSKLVENPETINVLFYAVKLLLEKMPFVQQNHQAQYPKLKTLAFLGLKCLCEYANVRSTLFENKDTKGAFIGNFVQNLI